MTIKLSEFLGGGYNGFTGSQGVIGFTGSGGDIGFTGSQGDIGFVGSQGPFFGIDVYTFGGTSTPTIGNAKTPYLRVMTNMVCTNASLVAKTAPFGGNFEVSVLKSSNNGDSFPDTVATVAILEGNHVGTTSANTALSTGDLLRIDITSVNGAADWTCQLYTTTT
jgi:hypothetical protein